VSTEPKAGPFGHFALSQSPVEELPSLPQHAALPVPKARSVFDYPQKSLVFVVVFLKRPLFLRALLLVQAQH